MKQISIKQQITTKDTYSLNKYFNELNKEALITPEQEYELAKRIRQGDKIAEQKLIRANLRFVISVAKQYQNQGLCLSDLISEGNYGLVKAAQKYDETKGFKFISYAVWWIKQSIIQAITDNSKTVRIPVNKLNLRNKVNKIIARIKTDEDREASFDEIAEELCVSINKVIDCISFNNNQSRLDDPIKADEEGTYSDLIKDVSVPEVDSNLINESMQTDIAAALSLLSEKEADILRMFFGIGYDGPISTEEIGEKYDMGSERIRQLKDRAVRRLRIVSKDLNLYL